MAQHQPIRKTAPPSGPDIPDKLYFRIGEVAKLCDVPAYVLRFWESEFPQLKPNKGGTGQRLYRRRDVEMALRVKRLLYDEGYTIPGARQVFKSELKQKEPQLPLPGAGLIEPRQLQSLRRELEAISAMLSRPVGKPPAKPGIHPIQTPRRTASRGAALRPPPQIPFGAAHDPDTANDPEANRE